MPATNELLQEGRYRINQETPLEDSGMIYDAYDTVRNTDVVVKEIAVRLSRVTTMSQQESLKVNFANQAKILTTIEHDSLLQVHDYFSEIGRQYLVMESVDGDDLAALSERDKNAFVVSDIVDWTDQLLDALNYLHTFHPPIIHRNVRPQNIKLSSNGRIKLLAFGLDDGAEQNLTTTLHDPSSTAVNYSPLELIWDGLDPASQKVILNSYDERSERQLKEPADPRSDIYSLGATLYHLVTGRIPVDPLERSIELLDGNADPLKAPHKVDPSIPNELSEVLMRALEIKRENRFDSALIMRQVVRTAMVRVQEREEEETREFEEAVEDIRVAEEMRVAGISRASVQKQKEEEAEQALLASERARLAAAEAERVRAEEAHRAEEEHAAEEEARRMLADQEEQRLFAEKQAADRAAAETEAEEKRLIVEQEAAATAAADQEVRERAEKEKADTEAAIAQKLLAAKQAKELAEQAEREAEELRSDLLAVEAAREKAELEAAEEARIRRENLEFEARAANVVIPEIETDDEDIDAILDAALIEANETPVVFEPEVIAYEAAAIDNDEVELGGLFAEQAEGSRKGLSMPMIAGAAVVVLVLAMVGYFIMSSASGGKANSPEAAAAPEVVQQQTAIPAETTAETASEPASSETPVESIQPPSLYSPAAAHAVSPAASAKAKKSVEAAPKPSAAKKKSITVDDLINDN
ncbi:MAG: serine/threonine protein kinase [Pyrinomonadaceae bacterium]